MACNTNVSLSGGSTDGLQGQKGAEHVILVAVTVEAPRAQFGRIPAARLSQLSAQTCDEVAQWHHTQDAADQLASAGNTEARSLAVAAVLQFCDAPPSPPKGVPPSTARSPRV